MDGPQGCPVSAEALAFDAFDAPYQLDPAEALAWSRAQEPVFWAPKLGYWVVSRYEHVKAVFRDVANFSPANALEKVTPNSAEANAVLARHGYAMNRTLVNEDEPAHTERRRALMHSFIPEELAHHEPMVRRLARAAVDRFMAHGHADLVDEMLWEVPLTVALHFLGVPEEDMATLRRYSIAHTVNTWGRPAAAEQLAVAEAVGKFWQFSGRVLDRMRINPAGHGWMEYAIRRQREIPEVVTDSYLHSMMMAGLVAAHETTAHASANAMRLLLERRDVWEELCADPGLIPNAVEECLRLSPSIVAWRRVALADTAVGGMGIPKGAKLLIVMASANRDGRRFENAEALDIHRENTTDHLSFGYGSHQCMGKNLARMEMRIFLEEFTSRLPHMELVPGQDFTYLPSLSFRGPDHLLVRWDPARNPDVPSERMRFAIGAPRRQAIGRAVRVADVEPLATGIAGLVLEDPHGRELPPWTAGSHVDLLLDGFVRTYSLCGDPADRHRYQIAVQREADGRGGSAHIHGAVRPGSLLRLRGPKNHFRLDETADGYVLIAGGIGITPILAMADRIRELGKAYTLHVAARARSSLPFLERLEREHAASLYFGSEGRRMCLPAMVRGDAPVYACGPARLIGELEDLLRDEPGRLHVEYFTAAGTVADTAADVPFEVELRDSGVSVRVAAGESLMAALQRSGIDVPSDCEEGLCGTCEVAVLSGEVEHRDRVLSGVERAANDRMMACCSRGRGRVVLGL